MKVLQLMKDGQALTQQLMVWSEFDGIVLQFFLCLMFLREGGSIGVIKRGVNMVDDEMLVIMVLSYSGTLVMVDVTSTKGFF